MMITKEWKILFSLIIIFSLIIVYAHISCLKFLFVFSDHCLVVHGDK